MATITAERIAELLATDPNWIVAWIVGQNPDAVADQLAVLGNTRPANRDAIYAELQYLLDEDRARYFVQALSVPVDVSAYDVDQQAAIYAAAGTSDDAAVGRKLATKALVLYRNAEVADEDETPVQAIAKAVDPRTTTGRRTLWRIAFVSLAIVGLVVTAAAVARYIKSKS